MNYRDTIEYHEYYLRYYRDSKKKHYRSALVLILLRKQGTAKHYNIVVAHHV